MTYYEVSGSFSSKGFFRTLWSPEKKLVSPFPRDRWHPILDLEFEGGGRFSQGGRLTEKTRKELQKLTCVLSAPDPIEPELIGDFSMQPTELPLVNDALKQAIEQVDPDCCEFLRAPSVWNNTLKIDVGGGPFNLVNVLDRRDAWAEPETSISGRPRVDGSIHYTINGASKVLTTAKIQDAHLWREARTGTVICSQQMRDALHSAGCENWAFVPLTTL